MQFQQELSIITKEDGTFNSKARQSFISTNFPEFYDAILDYTKNLDPYSSFSERLYHYYHKLPDDVLCEVCKIKKVTFLSTNTGYSKTCSSKCSQSHPETIRKREQTMMDTYGVLNPSQSKEVQDTIKKNNLKKYGVTNTAKLQSKKDKVKTTNQERYGSDTPAGNKEVMDKMISTNQERYGVDHTFSSDIVKNKIVETNLERYGVTNAAKHESIKDKAEKTNLERYGAKSTAQNKEVKIKTAETRNKIEYENYLIKFPNHDIKKCENGIMTVCCIHNHIYKINAAFFSQRVKVNKIENPCIICNPVNIGSICEKELTDYVRSLNQDCISNDRAQIGLELDCFIPSKNVAFEYN